jgi:hypothetical protein
VIELWKAVIERLLSWPVAVVLLALVFKQPLTKLLRRIRFIHVKGGGVEVSASSNAAKQLEAEDSSKRDPLSLRTGRQLELPLPEDIARRQEAVRTYGGDNPLLLEQIQNIKNDLETLHYPIESEATAEVLIRHLAATQLLQRAEFLYRVIFGSQLSAIRTLNETGPHPENIVRRFYDAARNRAPRFYGDYTFEQWVGFLLHQNVVVFENERYAITRYGREFLG